MWIYRVKLCILLGFLVVLFDLNAADDCGGEIHDFEGTIMSPGYPGLYPPNATCRWHIIAPPEHHISIHFTRVQLENRYDELTLKSLDDSGNVLSNVNRYSGNINPFSMVSTSNHLLIEFTSDQSGQLPGFAANFSIPGAVDHPVYNFVPDITTVLTVAETETEDQYKRDPIEIHSRTNALGLTYHWPNYGILEQFIQENDTVSWISTNCTWVAQDMIRTSYLNNGILKFKSTSSSVMSPVFIPSSPTLCFNVHLFAQISSRMTARITNSLGQEVANATFTSNSRDWNHNWLFEVPLPKNYKEGIQVKFMKTNDYYIGIKKVIRCDIKVDEQYHSITKEQISDTTTEASRFDSSSFGLSVGNRGNLQCLNGGAATEQGCACPGGFTGSSCEKGCGPNRFGHDCGGECSKLDQQCKGLLLCTPGVGCGCAPGYYGPKCQLKCTVKDNFYNTRDYYYGSNCSQECGKCSLDAPSCDIYNGMCPGGCVDGYWPPYCKEKLVHFLNGPELTAPEHGVISVSVDLSENNRQGKGNPNWFQIQYQKLNAVNWNVHITEKVSEETRKAVKIRGLELGALYSVRVIMLLENYNGYDESDVPKSDIRTKCYVPSDYNYNILATHTKYTSDHDVSFEYFTTLFSWRFEVEEKWCPINTVRISYKLGLKWNTFETSWKTNFSITNILPNKQILFKVRAITDELIQAPYSDVFSTTTPIGGPYKVENVSIVSIEANTCTLKWDVSPKLADLNSTLFKVVFKCLKRSACKENCLESKEELSTFKPSITLRGLLPTSKYQIAISANEGEPTVFIVGTTASEPLEVPVARKENPDYLETHQISGNTNTSISAQWDKGEVCSGFFKNFAYELYKANDLSRVLENGRTDLTQITFENLIPNTDYILRVFIETIDGHKSQRFLSIQATTDSTVPEQVQNLTVYKQGQHMLGLRWAKPRMVYGELEGFTLSYWQKNPPTSERSVTVKPTSCVTWPDLYCHTLQGLRPGQTYNVAVSAVNKNKPEPGKSSIVLGLTKEKSPGAPENLTIVNVTSSTVTVQWSPPFMQSGVLRTFLISVEEMETHNEVNCCQTFPVLEKTVTEEVLHHQLEISGLSPASTYTVSVAGRTNGFGPSQTMSVTTRPPPLLMTLPKQLVLDCGNISWESQDTTAHANDSIYQSLVVYHCILVLQNSTLNSVVNVESGIKDARLKELLDERLEFVYYLAAEYQADDLVKIPNEEGVESTWGTSQPQALDNNTSYQLAAVQVTEYNGVLNADILLSTPFTPC